MINTITRTYDVIGNGVNKLDVEIRYERGGWSYMTGRESERGYYFSVTPYELSNGWKRYVAYSGSKTCVLPCERQSKKRFEQAAAMMDDLIDAYLSSWLDENGISIGNEFTEKASER